MNDKKLNKMFPLTSVCRADMIGRDFTEKEIESITNSEMEYIASKITDAIMEVYWIALDIKVRDVLDRKKNIIPLTKKQHKLYHLKNK